MPKATPSDRCSFCGRPAEAVDMLLQGRNGVTICNYCVHASYNLLNEDKGLKANLGFEKEKGAEKGEWEIPSQLLTPKEMKARLDEYVIGQDEAKKILSVAVYNHYKRVFFKEKLDGVEIEKSNVLLLGPTGSGKTLLAKTLARILNVPFAIADATTLTEAGYVGEDVENILLQLFQNASGNIEATERGIIYIDEIDKIGRKGDNPSITRDVSGEGVQQALLKIVEGTVANVPPEGGRKHPQQKFIKINTSNILFIVAGAFIGLDEIIKQRVSGGTMGFSGAVRSKKDMSMKEILSLVEPQDLVKFGLIPELIGRIPVVASVDLLDEESLVRILKEPKNALITQYSKLFELSNVKLSFTDEALRAIAHKATERKTGARGLRNVMEHLMLDTMYTIPSMPDVKECLITEEVVQGNAEPTLVRG